MADSTSSPRRYTVSPRQAAEMLGVNRDTVLRYIRTGVLHATKINQRTIRIRQADIDQLLDDRRT